jgi:hypothetical protein
MSGIRRTDVPFFSRSLDVMFEVSLAWLRDHRPVLTSERLVLYVCLFRFSFLFTLGFS